MAVLAQTFAYFAVSTPIKKQPLIWESVPNKNPQDHEEMFVCLSAWCLGIQLLRIVCNLFILGVFYKLRYVCTCVCMCLCDCELDACSYYALFLKQTNSLQPNTEHSSTLESASGIGYCSGYRDIQ